MIHNILLKLEDKDFFSLSNIKSRYEMTLSQTFTWEEFIMRLKVNFERKTK